MTTLINTNRGRSFLSNAVGAGDTSIQVDDISTFPVPGANEVYYLTLENLTRTAYEICLVTAVDAGTDTFTVVRGQDNTSPQAWAQGDYAELRLTAAQLDYLDPLTTKGDLATFSDTPTRLGVGANGQVITANDATPTGLEWVDGGTGTYNEVQDAGSPVSLGRRILNFIGAGDASIVIDDQAGPNRTDITITATPGVGGGAVGEGTPFVIGDLVQVEDDDPAFIQSTGKQIANVAFKNESNTFTLQQFVDVDASVGGQNAVFAVTDTSGTEDATLSAWGLTASLSLRGTTSWHQWRQLTQLTLQRFNTGTGTVLDDDVLEVYDDAGLVLSSATGDSQGEGTLNAKGLFIDGTPVSTSTGIPEAPSGGESYVRRGSDSSWQLGYTQTEAAAQFAPLSSVVTTAYITTSQTYAIPGTLSDGDKIEFYVDEDPTSDEVTEIVGCTHRVSAGTCSTTVRVNGAPVTGLSGLGTTDSAQKATGTPTRPGGPTIPVDITIASASGASNLSVTIFLRHTVTLS